LAAGAASFSFAVAVPSPLHLKNLIADGRSQHVELRGLIVSDPRERTFQAEGAPFTSKPEIPPLAAENDDQPRRVDFVIEVHSLKLIDVWQPAEGRVLVYVSGSQRRADYQYGQTVRCDGVIEQPEIARNPGQFDFRAYLAARRIFHLLRVRADNESTVEQHNGGNWLVRRALRVRDNWNATLHEGLFDAARPSPETTRQVAGLISGMLLGYREEIPDDIKESFTRTSAMHIFAISGLNVAMAATVLFFALRLVRVPRRWCVLVIIPALFLFVLATGFSSSAIRAFVMAAVFLASWTLVRPADALNSLGAAALPILVVDPLQLFDGGFQMSFAVVASIIVCSSRLEKIFVAPFQPDPFIPIELVPRWSLWLKGAGRGLATWFSVTLAASLGSLPFIAYYFHIFSPISVLSNMALVPLAFVITVTGTLAVVASTVSSWLTVTFNNANLLFGIALIRLIEAFAAVPRGYRYVTAPPVWGMALYYAIVVVVFSGWIFRSKKRRVAGAAIAAVFVLTLGGHFLLQRNVTRLTILDVGSGSSVFLDARGERHDVLIDAGRERAGRYIVEPFLRSRGVDALPRAVVSQGDVAHAGGMSWVLRQIPVAEVIESGWLSPGARTQYRLRGLARELGVPLREIRAGDRIALANTTEIRVLHPPPRTPFKTMDDNALVLQLCAGKRRILLMSDVGATVENLLLNSDTDLRSDIVCFGQHRVEPNCTAAFLDRVKPRAVVITRGGTWGGKGPSPEMREALARRHIELIDTARVGAVTLELRPNDLQLKTVLSPQ
jgi:competence protein ComEC